MGKVGGIGIERHEPGCQTGDHDQAEDEQECRGRDRIARDGVERVIDQPVAIGGGSVARDHHPLPILGSISA
jgi:hypothetical protein